MMSLAERTTTELHLSDALPIPVLGRLMSSDTHTEQPAYPLYRVKGLVEAHAFGSVVFDSRRVRPIVLISPHSKRGYPFDVPFLVELVGELADVVVLDDANTIHNVAEAITSKFAAFSGAVRILRPGIKEYHPKDRHPVIAHREIGDQLDTMETVDKLVKMAVESWKRYKGKEPAVSNEVETLNAEIQAKILRERERNRELTTKLGQTKRAKENAEAALLETTRPVFADPHAQFRFELHHAWLHATEEGDRATWMIREWELGPKFLDSFAQQQIVDRPRIMRACVDVITGRHAEINSRASHVLRTKDGGGSDGRRREDGSAAWRCSINVGPSAARLMWWERPDGVVELSIVAQHDDIRIV